MPNEERLEQGREGERMRPGVAQAFDHMEAAARKDGISLTIMSALGDLPRDLVAAGAGLVDVGGESGRTDRSPIPESEEVARVVPLIERLTAESFVVSIDTWRAPVARAALAGGASMVNDVSGLADPRVAEV